MDRSSLVFCALALVAAFAVSALGFRFAALPVEVAAAARTPVPPEALPDIDLGEGWGVVSGIDLMGYWLERNPPDLTALGVEAPAPGGGASAAAASGGASGGHGGGSAVPPRKRFGGC